MSFRKQAIVFGFLCGATAIAMRLLAPADLLIYALALPFVWVGQGLRTLSLAGGWGNGAAWAVYVALCAAPLYQGLVRRRRGREAGRWWMRALMSGCLFFAVYQFINPAGLAARFGDLLQSGDGLLLAQSMVAGLCWSIAVAWWVLCMLGRAQRTDLLEGLRLLLKAVGALAILEIFYVRLYALLGCVYETGLQFYSETGQAVSGLLALGSPLSPYQVDWSGVFQCLLAALPGVCLLRLLVPGFSLLRGIAADPYGEAAVQACERVARRAKEVVYACLAATAGQNALTLLWPGRADVYKRQGIR